MRSFREYQPNERRNYITLSTGEYYPDILVDACKLYSPVLTIFSDSPSFRQLSFFIPEHFRSIKPMDENPTV